MIGIALVSFIATLTAGMKASNREAIEEQVAADFVVTSLGRVHAVRRRGRGRARGVLDARARHQRALGARARSNGETAEISGIDPDTIAAAYNFDWREGDDSVLADARHEERDRERELRGGSRRRGGRHGDDHARSTDAHGGRSQSSGPYEPPPFYPLLDSVSVSNELFDSLWDRPRNRWTWANVAGEPTAEAKGRMAQAIAGFPDTQIETREEWIEREDADFNSSSSSSTSCSRSRSS